jgi:hypothetical protein
MRLRKEDERTFTPHIQRHDFSLRSTFSCNYLYFHADLSN